MILRIKKILEVVKVNYDTFEVTYYGLDNNDYVNGLGFCCNPAGETSSSSSTTTGKLMAGKNDNAELQQFYYHPDHLGSSSYISNLDGEVVQHVEYVPFGEVFLEEKNAKWNTPYLFTSKELDKETGLYYFGARYYDPKTSIWASVDPMMLREQVFSDPESTNGGVYNNQNLAVYAFSYNNPVKYVDPDGECPNCVTAAAGALIGGLIGGGIEVGMQLHKTGKVSNWNAVGGASLQGAVIGGAAGFTGGASLAVTAGTLGTANVVGGAANRAIQGEGTTGKDMLVDFVIGAGLGVAGAKLNSYISRFVKSSAGQSMSSQVSGLAKKLGIYSAQNSLKQGEGGAAIVSKYLAEMEAGTFNKGGAGFIDKSGKIVLSDGNHSMNAALEYSIKTGDSKYIKMIIEKGNFTKNVDLKSYGISAKPLPTK